MNSLYNSCIDCSQRTTCPLILFGLVSNNLAWCCSQTCWSGLWHLPQRAFFEGWSYICQFSFLCRDCFPQSSEMAGMTLRDYLPRKDQCAQENPCIRRWNLTLVPILLLFVLLIGLWGEQWLPSSPVSGGLSLYQAGVVFTEAWANRDCALCEDKALPARRFVWPLRVWTSNICAWVLLLLEREAELWATGALRVLQFTDPLHSLFFICPANSRTKQMRIIPQLKRIYL